MSADTSLPDADEIFLRFFAPWYAAVDLSRRKVSATRPDVQSWAKAGVLAVEASPLMPEAQHEAAEMVDAMLHAATSDWPESIGVSGTPSSGWIDTFDNHYDRRRVTEVVASAAPAEFDNELVVLCCEFGTVLGEVLRTEAPTLEWLYDWPYWESSLYDPDHGMRINVFHWAIKKFSDYGVDDGFRAKVLQVRDLVRRGWPNE